jgi:hypothetical protein
MEIYVCLSISDILFYFIKSRFTLFVNQEDPILAFGKRINP